MTYYNSIFLVFPPLGAALAGFVKFYWVTLITIVQVGIPEYFLLIFAWLCETNCCLPTDGTFCIFGVTDIESDHNSIARLHMVAFYLYP